MCAYCYIRFLITSCVHERRIRIILFIAFLLPSTPNMIRAHARLSDMMPSASSRCRPRVSSRFQRAHSFVRSNTYSVNDRIFYSGSLLFKLLGVQHNQTLPAIQIWYRTNVTLESAFNTIRDTEYKENKERRLQKSRRFWEIAISRNAPRPDYNSSWRVILLVRTRRSISLPRNIPVLSFSL